MQLFSISLKAITKTWKRVRQSNLFVELSEKISTTRHWIQCLYFVTIWKCGRCSNKVLGLVLSSFFKLTLSQCLPAESEPAMKEFISAFSMRKNTIQLLESKPSDHPPFHFCKVIAMQFIIFGHLFIVILGSPLYNTEYIENVRIASTWHYQLIRSFTDLYLLHFAGIS